MTDIHDLRRRFSIPGAVNIEPGHGGLTRVALLTEQAEAHVYLHGAHVTHYRPRAGNDVLFLSDKSQFEPGHPIRGGVPVIFPWFGPRAGDASAPAHGFARTQAWTLTDVTRTPDGSVSLTIELASSEATRKLWPYDFLLRYTVTIGSLLELSLEVQNTSSTPFTYEEALHTYLCVEDVKKVAIEGLAGRTFIDKMDSGARKTQGPGNIAIIGETDRVYLDTPDTVTVTDPDLARQLCVEKEGSGATVLWNPWVAKSKAMPDFGDDEWPGMLCVETANAADNALTLPPGKIHRMLARISWNPTRPDHAGHGVKQWEMSQMQRQ